MGEERPTQGPPRIVVTRRIEQAPALCTKLSTAGLTPIVFPTIRLAARPTQTLDMALAELTTYDWLVFTSGNAVEFFLRRVEALEVDVGRSWSQRPSIAAVGKATARALAQHGLEPDFMPSTFTGAALATELDDPAGQRILLPRAQAGGRPIVDGLRSRGATVVTIPLYDTVTATPTADALAELEQGFEAIIFASPSSVNGLLEIAAGQGNQLGRQIRAAAIACIGPVTAEAARKQGLTVTLVPEEYTFDALIQTLVDYFNRQPLGVIGYPNT